jgi:hypothetical protein
MKFIGHKMGSVATRERHWGGKIVVPQRRRSVRQHIVETRQSCAGVIQPAAIKRQSASVEKSCSADLRQLKRHCNVTSSLYPCPFFFFFFGGLWAILGLP